MAPLDCTTTFTHQDAEGFDRNLLVLTEKGNGPQYFFDEFASRTHWTDGKGGVSDKLYMDFNMDRMNSYNGEVNTLNVQQRITYGMSMDSYCLTRLPTYWSVREETEVTTSITGGNLTFLTN